MYTCVKGIDLSPLRGSANNVVCGFRKDYCVRCIALVRFDLSCLLFVIMYADKDNDEGWLSFFFCPFLLVRFSLGGVSQQLQVSRVVVCVGQLPWVSRCNGGFVCTRLIGLLFSFGLVG